MHSEDPLVLGLDIGGTSSRALVGDLSGRTLGTGEAGGGNPNSHPPEQAVEQVATAVRAALAGLAPGAVRSGVLGLAGKSKMSDPAVAELFERTWSSLGLTCPMRVISDCEVAFAAATPAPAGTVVVAGTGAVATRIDQHRLVATAGGYGWLLGDEGSAFWLGREAVRETLRVLDQHEQPVSELVSTVLTALSAPDESPVEARNHVITSVNARPPIRLAELAPLVTGAARGGDKAAIDIVRRGAALLADTAQSVRRPEERTPIVLAGGLVAPGNPMGKALRAELAARCSGELLASGSGAAGAAWLAALELLDADDDTTQLHSRYLTP